MTIRLTSTSSYTAKHAYKLFRQIYPESEVTYALFKFVLSEFNKRVSDRILAGETFTMSNRIGKLAIKKMKRNFKKPKIDWGETNKLARKGIRKLVYFTEPYWYRFYWAKRKCNIKNKSVYRFRASWGNKKRLVEILKTDEFAPMNYKLNP